MITITDTLTSAHKAHVFQLHVYHSLSCVPLRPCVIDSLGLVITCVLYHSTMCMRHPDLVSFAFYAIPIFHIIICDLLVFIMNCP